MARFGWSAPEGSSPDEEEQVRILFPGEPYPGAAPPAAKLVVQTLAKVLRVRHPTELEYRSGEHNGEPEKFHLGIPRIA